MRRVVGSVLVAVMMAAAGPAAAQETASAETVAERLREQSLETKVLKALVSDPALRSYDFEPEAEGNVVTLFGQVNTRAEYARAASVAERVEGVRAVVNELTVTQSEARIAPAETPSAGEAPVNTSQQYHTVKNGESLWLIARRYDTSISSIKRLNKLRSNTVKPGQRLRVK